MANKGVAFLPVEDTEADIRKGPCISRTKQIARLVALGSTNKQIGHELGISEHTVKVYVYHIMRKYDLPSRLFLAILALEQGIVTLEEMYSSLREVRSTGRLF